MIWIIIVYLSIGFAVVLDHYKTKSYKWWHSPLLLFLWPIYLLMLMWIIGLALLVEILDFR